MSAPSTNAVFFEGLYRIIPWALSCSDLRKRDSDLIFIVLAAGFSSFLKGFR